MIDKSSPKDWVKNKVRFELNKKLNKSGNQIIGKIKRNNKIHDNLLFIQIRIFFMRHYYSTNEIYLKIKGLFWM